MVREADEHTVDPLNSSLDTSNPHGDLILKFSFPGSEWNTGLDTGLISDDAERTEVPRVSAFTQRSTHGPDRFVQV